MNVVTLKTSRALTIVVKPARLEGATVCNRIKCLAGQIGKAVVKWWQSFPLAALICLSSFQACAQVLICIYFAGSAYKWDRDMFLIQVSTCADVRINMSALRKS